MNKSILISIKPKWVAKILNGEKTIEIRKTMPKCELPIDVYIYCTKCKVGLYDNHNHITSASDKYFLDTLGYDKPPLLNGKVVAKFTLNKVEEIYAVSLYEAVDEKNLLKKSCLTKKVFHSYLDTIDFSKKPYKPLLGYAWHISNLVIFDRPKPLWHFHRVGGSSLYQRTCKKALEGRCNVYPCQKAEITKAPQSWCYVEV